MGKIFKRWYWQAVKACDLLRAIFWHVGHRRGHRKPLFLDIGARGGPSRKWDLLRRLGIVEACLVEPDAKAAQALAQRYPGVSVLPYPLGDVDGQPVTLHIGAEPGVSSILEPNRAVVDRYSFGSAFNIVDRIALVLRRFDLLVAAGTTRRPDFVKIDVQGVEFQVLEGFGTVLDHVLAIELEAQFEQLYRDQKLFGDVYSLLLAKGFGLLAIRPQSNFDEFNIVEANFFFARDLRKLDPEQRAMVEMWRRLMRIPSSNDMTVATG